MCRKSHHAGGETQTTLILEPKAVGLTISFYAVKSHAVTHRCSRPADSRSRSASVTTGSAALPPHFLMNFRGSTPYRAAKSRLNCDRCRYPTAWATVDGAFPVASRNCTFSVLTVSPPRFRPLNRGTPDTQAGQQSVPHHRPLDGSPRPGHLGSDHLPRHPGLPRYDRSVAPTRRVRRVLTAPPRRGRQTEPGAEPPDEPGRRADTDGRCDPRHRHLGITRQGQSSVQPDFPTPRGESQSGLHDEDPALRPLPHLHRSRPLCDSLHGRRILHQCSGHLACLATAGHRRNGHRPALPVTARRPRPSSTPAPGSTCPGPPTAPGRSRLCPSVPGSAPPRL